MLIAYLLLPSMVGLFATICVLAFVQASPLLGLAVYFGSGLTTTMLLAVRALACPAPRVPSRERRVAKTRAQLIARICRINRKFEKPIAESD